MSDTKRRWQFHIQDMEGDDHYVDAQGKTQHADEYFIGTTSEAAAEAGRRADLWENLPGNGWPLRVTYESHGKVNT